MFSLMVLTLCVSESTKINQSQTLPICIYLEKQLLYFQACSMSSSNYLVA